MSDKFAIPDSEKKKIRKALDDAISNSPARGSGTAPGGGSSGPVVPTQLTCPICLDTNFKMEKAYFLQLTQTNYHKLSNGGEKVPMAPFICQNCGFVANFSLKPLGLYKK